MGLILSGNIKSSFLLDGGITYDTAAFAFRTKDILKIRSRPRLEPGSDYHYLVRITGLEPAQLSYVKNARKRLMNAIFAGNCYFCTAVSKNIFFDHIIYTIA